jgi:hypothetical protein
MQGAGVAALRARPKTKHRSASCALGGRNIILNRAHRRQCEDVYGEAR